ncbi:multidrug effflux MFS transporter [Leucobacter celer]|uniref:multidrug effflux MFS transporter n=1 Tax=Leucobacter celer TaxID=668625 RepID=UPI0006A7C48C|nr:multidrug effflux MFS transporter [Leucobacter celer]
MSLRIREPRVTPLLIAVLGLLSMGGAFAMDTYLPALPDVGRDLAAPPALVQMTLTAFLIGQALGQFVLGPMSDRWGRWWPLLIGSGVFLAAGLGAVFADGIWILIACRFVQGVGSAAGPVIGRAVVADLASGVQAARLFGVLMMLFGLAPVIAPVLGGPLAEWGGWRATMWGVVVVSAVALLSVLLVPESLPAERRRVVHLGTVARDFLELARNRPFFLHSLLITSSFGVVTAWLATSSFVLQGHFGLSPTAYSLAFAMNSAGFLLAGLLNTLLLRRFRPESILRSSVIALGIGAGSLLVLLAVGFLPLWLLLVLVTATFASVAPLMANATALGIGAVERNRAGGASALMGAMETLIPAAFVPVLGLFGSGPGPLVVAFAISASACVGLHVALRAGSGREAPSR